MRLINGIIIHTAATKPSMDIGASEIDEWHKARGWSGIGYHYVIRRDGEIETGRPIQKSGAHAKGYNANSIGICLVGGIDDDGKPEQNYTKPQWKSLDKLVQGQKVTYDIEDDRILGHRDLPEVSKACPVFDVKEWLLAAGDYYD